MKSFAATVVLLSGLLWSTSAEKGCPQPEEIAPCVCTESPLTYLECKNVDDPELLRTIFQNSARYSYKEVHLEYCSLQFLPHDMFEAIKVKELYLTNVTLRQLFDEPPEALDELRLLHIENTKVFRGILWELLKPLKSLKIINVYFNTVKKLGKDFSENAPIGLEQLTFYATETKTIEQGVFNEFTNLDKLAIDACRLENLQRDILPIPWNGRVIYLNENKLSEIPVDMFSQMPNLQTLGLRGNQIATIPESAFEGTGGKLEYLMLQSNPIKCDCRIEWLVKKKPPALSGTCETPKALHGKELKDVSLSDLNC